MALYFSFLYVSLLTDDKSDTTTFNCSIIQLFNHSLIGYGTHAVYHGVWVADSNKQSGRYADDTYRNTGKKITINHPLTQSFQQLESTPHHPLRGKASPLEKFFLLDS